MHRNAELVQAALRARGSAAEVVELPSSARTSAEAAASLGVEVGQIAKSLVFLADGALVVAVLSGADRLDTARLGRLLGARRVERAGPDAVREATGFPIGGVSPVGHGLPVVVDAGLAAHDVVWAAAGTPNAVFRTSHAELLSLVPGSWAGEVRVEDPGPAAPPAG